MVRRSKQDALATRNLILDTAERVFARRGVSRTSLQEIAQCAGVSRGAIYWHFKDKAALFEAIMQRVLLPMEQGPPRLAETRGDAIADLRARCIDALARIVADPQVRRVFEIAIHKVEYVDELVAVRDRRRDVSRLHLASIERVMLREIRSGAPLRRNEAHAAALGLHALLEGLIQNWMLDPEAFDLVRVGTRAVDSYLAGLGLLEFAPRSGGMRAGQIDVGAGAKPVRALVGSAAHPAASAKPPLPLSRRVPA
jgi:TetR/AcrR family acrAB operon transcriptional repressor